MSAPFPFHTVVVVVVVVVVQSLQWKMPHAGDNEDDCGSKKVIDFCRGLSTLLLGLFSHGHFCGHEFGQESMLEKQE